jgi:hypothetical protein
MKHQSKGDSSSQDPLKKFEYSQVFNWGALEANGLEVKH